MTSTGKPGCYAAFPLLLCASPSLIDLSFLPARERVVPFNSNVRPADCKVTSRDKSNRLGDFQRFEARRETTAGESVGECYFNKPSEAEVGPRHPAYATVSFFRR